MDKKIILKDQIGVQEEINIQNESEYLITSNKEKSVQLLGASDLNFNDIIDILISLHMVLEISLNALYRHLSLLSIKKNIGEIQIRENIDNIDFINKTILFIYNSNFNFNGKLTKAKEYHKIINTIKDFSGIRNKLIHGHSIVRIQDGDGARFDSALRRDINLKFLGKQIKKFRFILKGMCFYLDCLDSNLTEQDKNNLKQRYLDDRFLPVCSFDSEP